MGNFVGGTFAALALTAVLGLSALPASARQDDMAAERAAERAMAAEARAAEEKALADARSAFEDRDYASALDQLLPLAENGNPDAQNLVGSLYRTGALGLADYDQAALWFEAAVAQHHPEALFNLGLMYFQHELDLRNGRNTRYAFSEAAFVRFHEAAELGHADAQLYVGHMYAEGMGVDRDPIEAYKWYQLSAWQRNSLATSARDRLSGKLTSDQIHQAKESARAFSVTTAN